MMLVEHKHDWKQVGLLIFTSKPKGLHSITHLLTPKAHEERLRLIEKGAESNIVNLKVLLYCLEALQSSCWWLCGPAIMAAHSTAHNVSHHIELAELTQLVFQQQKIIRAGKKKHYIKLDQMWSCVSIAFIFYTRPCCYLINM